MAGARDQRAAGREDASGGPFGAAHLAPHDARCGGNVGVHRQLGADEELGVGVFRVGQDLVGGADLHDSAQIHHRHPLADGPDRLQVVGDEDVGEVQLPLQAQQQPQHALLHGHVERGRRFVEDEHPRRRRQRSGDVDPLLLSPGEFVGITARQFRRERHLLQQLVDSPRQVGSTQVGVQEQGLGDRLPDAVAGVQRLVGLLEDDLHLAAPRAKRLGRGVGDGAAQHLYRAGINRGEPQDAAGDGRLSRAALADDAERPPVGHREADILRGHHVGHAAPGAEGLVETLDGDGDGAVARRGPVGRRRPVAHRPALPARSWRNSRRSDAAMRRLV